MCLAVCSTGSRETRSMVTFGGARGARTARRLKGPLSQRCDSGDGCGASTDGQLACETHYRTRESGHLKLWVVRLKYFVLSHCRSLIQSSRACALRGGVPLRPSIRALMCQARRDSLRALPPVPQSFRYSAVQSSANGKTLALKHSAKISRRCCSLWGLDLPTL